MKSAAEKRFWLRRRLLAGAALALAQRTAALAQAPGANSRPTPEASRPGPFALVVPGYRMRFPHDEGSHPEFRLEWWYVTGWLEEPTGPLGFQVTFFRARPELRHENPSAFTPRQIVIAHAALSDPAHGRLVHAQRAARAGFGLAGAEQGRVQVWIGEWRLEQREEAYRALIPAREFSMELAFAPTQPPIRQGQEGYSRKGRAPESASYYYSIPHLRVRGALARGGRSVQVAGTAWFDHEWSSQYMEQEAAGWDWIGINLEDGGALMAFRMRDARGGHYWAGGALRDAAGRTRTFSPDEVRFVPRREWRSPRTGAAYPVSFVVQAGGLELVIEPLFDDQEHDARATTGTIYWEGAARALIGGKPAGRGYLELTGYWRRPQL
ncbi:MAG TPA: carotenoid 1,2-hydratase [Burkholderiales bacterium]|nr:carotenoid 1,2-hydratase [Burkholderiales bacterium]